MPRGRGYGGRRKGARRGRYRGRRLASAPSRAQMTKYGSVTGSHFLRGTNRVAALYDAAKMAKDAVDAIHPLIKGIPPMHKRSGGRKPKLKIVKSSGKLDRHEKLKQKGTVGPVNRGNGFDSGPNGVVVTHGKGMIPRWKQQRLRKYKDSVWQTVLLSKSNRLAASNNVLETARYPIKCPEGLDSERVQSMIFTPFCSHFSGIHSTMFRKVRSSDGADIDHDTSQLLDVIQNRADIARHELPGSVDGTGGSAITHESDFPGGAITAAAARGATNQDQVHKYYDQLVKTIKCDLVFTASRAFPVKVSVCVVRHIDATAPYVMTADDKKMLLNNLDNKGLAWDKYKTEWLHQFTLPALAKGKKPPQYSVNKTLKCNWLNTNTFEKNNVAEALTQAGTTQLGKGIDVRVNEVSDGDVSGMFYVLIKYRKVQQPQQFTYKQAIEADSNFSTGITSAFVELPVLTEESFNVPVSDGLASGSGTGFEDGNPLSTDQGDESKPSMYVHGKLVYEWGFRREPESIPSIVSSDPSHADYKKGQSLMIDPTYTSDDTYGCYTESPDHVQLAGSTANTGP